MILNKENLIEELGNDYDYKIFRYFLGFDFKLGVLYKSPFRDERSPSFNVFEHSKSSKLYFKDFGEEYRGDCFQFVQYLFGLSFYECLKFISRTFGLSFEEASPDYVKPLIIKPSDFSSGKEDTIIQFQTRKFEKKDFNYWSQYNISSETLNRFEVKACNAVWINRKIWAADQQKDLIYAECIEDRVKIYRPLANKDYKWRSNLKSNDIFGYKQLPESGEICIITKSIKDVMVLQHLSFPAVSGQSENIDFDKELIRELYNRFDNILIYFDNDKKGIEFAEKQYKEHGLLNIVNSNKEFKDISDYIKEFGKENTQKMIEKLIYG